MRPAVADCSIAAEDLMHPAVEDCSGGDAQESGEQSTPRTVANKKLSALQGEEIAQLLHTDSGFDEQMVDELRLDVPAGTCEKPRSYDDDEHEYAVEAEGHEGNEERQ